MENTHQNILSWPTIINCVIYLFHIDTGRHRTKCLWLWWRHWIFIADRKLYNRLIHMLSRTRRHILNLLKSGREFLPQHLFFLPPGNNALPVEILKFHWQVDRRSPLYPFIKVSAINILMKCQNCNQHHAKQRKYWKSCHLSEKNSHFGWLLSIV